MTALCRYFSALPSPMRSLWWIIFATMSGVILPGAEPTDAPSLPGSGSAITNHALVSIGPGLFKMGEVCLDKTRRSVRFPAVVNLRDGNIEYVVVHASGKTHESIFKTDAQPQHVQLALLLLGARGATNALPEDPAKALPGTPVVVEVGWTNVAKAGGKPVVTSLRAETFVHNRRTQAAAATGDWIYTGSRIREDGFAAQVDGSIVSLITDPDALVNNPRPGREDDDNWLVLTNDLPALGTSVEVVLRLVDPVRPAEKSVR